MRKWFVRLVVAAISSMLIATPLVLAATPAPTAPATPSGGSPGQGLEISPPVMELAADPGQTITVKIRVRNVTKDLLIAKGKADDFGAGTDESGQPKLLIDEPGATRYSLKYWVSGVPDLQLAPQELKTTTITIAVPKNAEPGGHFGVVRFTALPPDLSGTGVALSASVGTLILLRVSGPVTEKVSLAEFSLGQAVKDKKTGNTAIVKKSFFETGPIQFLVRLKNEGSVHEKASGSITVKGGLTGGVPPIAVNKNGGNVLPESIRRFEQTLDKKQLFGRYTAKLDLTYANNKKIDATISFWVIPWKMLLLLLIGLVALVFILRLALRRYNEHIIARARRQ